MSSAKDIMIDNEEFKRDELVAKELGVSIDELNSVSFEVSAQTSHDGDIVDYYLVTFDESTPDSFLDKISSNESGYYYEDRESRSIGISPNFADMLQ